MDPGHQQHLAWLAQSFGRTDYLPLTPDDLEALSGAGEYVDKYAGTHIFREGEPADAAYLIHKGRVEVYRSRGTTRHVIARVGEGAVIGDIAMFQEREYLSAARALDAVRVFRFDKARLLPLLVDHPVIAIRWLVAGLNQLESTQRRVIRLMRRTVREQVAEVLLDEADRFGEVHVSQETLATLLGASRQSVNETLAVFRASGIVATGYRVIQVLDPEELARITGHERASEK